MTAAPETIFQHCGYQLVRRRALAESQTVLSIVIVNYQQWENTFALVAQLRQSELMANGLAEILIVDNHSDDHPLIEELVGMEGVSLRRWQENRGFSKGVNGACRFCQGEWILLLNPDMTLPEDFCDSLSQALREYTDRDNLGVVGFALRHSNGSQQLSAGKFPTLWSTLMGLFLPRSQRKYQRIRSDSATSVDWVTGCCMLIRRDCFVSMDGFDTSFFLYYEDVDFCRRANAGKWEVFFDPRLYALHHHPLHTRKVPEALRVITRHSLLTYAWKHWPRWQWKLLARIVLLEAWVRGLKRKNSPMNQFLRPITISMLRNRLGLGHKKIRAFVAKNRFRTDSV